MSGFLIRIGICKTKRSRDSALIQPRSDSLKLMKLQSKSGLHFSHEWRKARKNVLPDGVDAVHTMTLGAVTQRTDHNLVISAKTKPLEHVTKVP